MAKASQKRQKIDSKTKVETSTNSNSNSNSNNNNNINIDEQVKGCTTKRKRTRRSLPRDSPSQRSSIYRGVTRHRWTGRFEAHLWDKDCWSDSQKKKGRQVYLGAYDDEATAARAYDLAALKYWGKETTLNFPVSNYEKELQEMEGIDRGEYIGSLRRKSSGFSRGVSKYRGVARHHHNGRWEARIGRVNGNKYLYLGTYATQEEAATAYDMAAIEHRGPNAVTNFDLSRYIHLIKPININNNTINNNNINSNNNSCDYQPNPNQFEPTKSIETTSASSTTTCSPMTLDDHPFEQIYDQFEENDCIDVDLLWGDQSSVQSSSTLLGLEDCNLLQSHSSDYGSCSFLDGPGIEFGSDEDCIFSELNSFLRDFDEEQSEELGECKG
ncbi:hypothetical protein RND81_08G039600 [Saponaria officinalis]|uniref:AP2/ERF domain-containing protein n=1 Tax=Saponaria officinalis TaxID=3572 RepID=A0AAW1J445_SAPOF